MLGKHSVKAALFEGENFDRIHKHVNVKLFNEGTVKRLSEHNYLHRISFFSAENTKSKFKFRSMQTALFGQS